MSAKSIAQLCAAKVVKFSYLCKYIQTKSPIMFTESIIGDVKLDITPSGAVNAQISGCNIKFLLFERRTIYGELSIGVYGNLTWIILTSFLVGAKTIE